jgi:hypothetical protein
VHPDSFHSAATLTSGATTVNIFRLKALAESDPKINLTRLPFSLRILLENLLRHEDGRTVTADDIRFLANWDPKAEPSREIAYMPARVLMQDFTGVPAIVDLAAMRDAMRALGGDPEKINPLQPAELVIDHSVQVDEFGTVNSYDLNAALEFSRNRERYAFLKWGQTAFNNFSAVPPGMGICHQVNLEYLARVVFTTAPGRRRQSHRLSRHPGRHRLPHHHGQRSRRPRLGRRRHRGRGRHARPARLHAGPAGRRLPPHRQAEAKAPPPPTSSSPSPKPCASTASSASSSSSTAPASPSCRSPTAPPSPTWPPSTAPPAASSPSTPRP